MSPNSAFMAAAPGTAEAFVFVEKLNSIIIYPLIVLLTGIAFLVFLYGCLIYIINADNSSAREEGRRHIIFSLIGMFVMLSAYAILQLASATFGVNDVLDCTNNPSGSGCDNVMRVPGSGGYSGGANTDGGTNGGANTDGGTSGAR